MPQLFAPAGGRSDKLAFKRLIEPFPVDAHTGRDKQSLDGTFLQGLQQDSGSLVIDARISSDLVHTLTDAHHGGEMKDGIYAVKGVINSVRIANIATNQLRLRRKIIRPLAIISVNLRFQAIQYADKVAVPLEFIRQVRTNKTGAPGD